MLRAAIYCRVSTKEQADSRLGLQSQARLTRELVGRLGAKLICEPIEDAGVSAGVPIAERHAGAELTRLVSSHSVDMVIALDQDRLFRDIIDCIATLRRWHELNVRLILVDGGEIGVEDPDGFLTVGIKALTGEYFRLKTKQRTRRALKEVNDSGRRVGPAPLGMRNNVTLRADGSKLNAGIHVPDAKELRIVRRVLELASDHGPVAIARQLNDEGYRTRRGRQFQHGQIQHILGRKAFYEGVLA